MKTRCEVYKRIFKQLKKYKFFLLITLLCCLVTVIGTLAVPVFFGEIINLTVAKGQVYFDKIFIIFLIISSCVGITSLSQWIMNIINNHIAYGIIKDIREEAFSHIQKLPLKFIDSHPYGDIVSRNIADVDQFADGLLMGFTQLFTGILTIIGTLIIMLIINWLIALSVVILTPLSLFVAKFISSKTYSLFRRTSEVRGEQTAFIDEMVGNLKVVQTFNRENENLKKFDEINVKLTNASLKSIFYSSLTNPSTRLINSIIYAIVALLGSFMLIFNVATLPIAFSVGLLISLLSYANQYTKPFNEISGVITEFQNAVACAGRIYELIDEQGESSDESAEILENVSGNVEFKDVNFSYVSDKKLIENFNIKVCAGKRIAIVGPTGCGKTTLINLLLRFYEPDCGQILVDGKDILGVTRKSLRKNYGMVLQDTWLKSGTIMENITLGKPNATEEEVITAAKAAHSHNFIMQMPNGYNTEISEDGGNLSQGQKQLLCITRIMLCLPPMLILDEATSSIDTRTEHRIQKAFSALMRGRTSFIVAHRLSTIKEADLIIVMNNGNIVEQGTHETLLKRGGLYSKLYQSQFAIFKAQ